jgi:hypothetical protein
MNPTILRNADATVRGYIHYLGNHRTEIRNANGQPLGWYSPSSNITYYIDGYMVGFGNLLASLI